MARPLGESDKPALNGRGPPLIVADSRPFDAAAVTQVPAHPGRIDALLRIHAGNQADDVRGLGIPVRGERYFEGHSIRRSKPDGRMPPAVGCFVHLVVNAEERFHVRCGSGNERDDTANEIRKGHLRRCLLRGRRGCCRGNSDEGDTGGQGAQALGVRSLWAVIDGLQVAAQRDGRVGDAAKPLGCAIVRR